MKNKMIIGLLISMILTEVSNAQYRYDLLNGVREMPTLRVESQIVQQFVRLVDNMYTRDSLIRHQVKDQKMEASCLLREDSINFSLLAEFTSRQSLFPLNKTNLPDSALREKTQSKMYALSIHFADRYGLLMMKFLEQSIKNGTSNPAELQQFMITYLWRNTEFNRGNGRYFIVPLPDILEISFRGDYLNAIKSFVNGYVRTSKNKVQYTIVANYYTQDCDQFLKSTQTINTALVGVGYIPGYVDLTQLQFCIRDFQKSYHWPPDSWLRNKDHKYYLICSDLSLKFSPVNHILN